MWVAICTVLPCFSWVRYCATSGEKGTSYCLRLLSPSQSDVLVVLSSMGSSSGEVVDDSSDGCVVLSDIPAGGRVSSIGRNP